MTTTTTKQHPLANDANGDPLEVPPHAAAWRVRRGGGRRGRPRVVFDAETGRQLEIGLGATLEDLIDHGCPPGRYPIPKPHDFNPVGRWRAWSAAEKRAFKRCAGKELCELGYADDLRW